MTVMILERVTPSLRGELSRWLVEIATGTFVGRISGLVRDELWKRCTERASEGSVLQVWRTSQEQGFDLRSHNLRDRVPVHIEGLWLAMIPRNDDATIVDVTETGGVRRSYTIDVPPDAGDA